MRSCVRVVRLLARYLLQRLGNPRGTTLYLGNALTARLFRSALDLGVEIQLKSKVSSLIQERGRIVGVEIVGPEQPVRLGARNGVVLATGGISHDVELRSQYVPPWAGQLSATVKSGAEKGGARLALERGGRLRALGPMGGAFWVPSSRFRRKDGAWALFPHTVTDRAKPGLIAVDSTGQRFVNEAVSYHEFVLAQLRAPGTAIPAYLLCDHRFLWKYGLGRIRPFTVSVATYVAEGYLKRAATIAALAVELGLPAQNLLETVREFNADAVNGLDRKFERGSNIYQRHLGDSDCKPNPCVAPIAHGPFYAVAVYPADLAMSAGIVTDSSARVLGTNGAVIPGLYACGNDMNSMMAGAYPAPGITLGPALTFGYIAARTAAGTIPQSTGSEP